MYIGSKFYASIIDAKVVVKEAQALGMSVVCLFIVGGPTKTKKDLQDSIRFAKSLSPEIIQVAYFVPFPGSKAYQLFKNKIKGISFSNMYHYRKPSVNLSGMNDDELKKAQDRFYKNFIFRLLFISRHLLDHIAFYVANPYVFVNLFSIVKQIVYNKFIF